MTERYSYRFENHYFNGSHLPDRSRALRALVESQPSVTKGDAKPAVPVTHRGGSTSPRINPTVALRLPAL